MEDPREQELVRLKGATRRRAELIRELAAEHSGERGYQERLAKLSGLTKARISQIARSRQQEQG
jgi:hypothetical protein